MKRTVLFICLVLSISSLYSQDSKILYCKKQSCLYTNCATDQLIGNIPVGLKVKQISKNCYENILVMATIEVTIEEKVILTNGKAWLPNSPGWVYPDNFYPYEEYRLDSIKKRSEYILDSLDKVEIKRKALRQQQIADSLKQVSEKLKHSKPFWIKSVIVTDLGRNASGILIDFLNTSQKTIKYINFTAVPYNAVDDLVTDEFGHNSKSCQLIGPIKPDEPATYYNDILFFSGVISYYKIRNVSVQYMDNTVKYFNSEDIFLPKSNAY